TAQMRFVDDRFPDLRSCSRVDLDRPDAPPLQVIQNGGDLRRVRNGATHIAMDWRITVQKRAASEYSGTRIRMRFGEPLDESCGNDLITRAADRSHPGSQIQRQDLVARNMCKVQHMDEMDMG